MSTIGNSNLIPINVRTGTIPDVSGAMKDWYQPLVFNQVSKAVVDFQVVETLTPTAFHGVVQPLTEERLALKPEGQRHWMWLWVHAEPALKLEVDDIIEYQNVKYRVTAQRDYGIYGYVDYELVQDWTGPVPTLTYTILQYGLTMPGAAA